MIYNFLLFLGTLFALPKWLFQRKYRGSIKARLGFQLPARASGKKSIWIHMVSVGEVRAMIPIYSYLKQRYPDRAFYLSTTTQTGQQEAKRSLLGAHSYFFLPIDYSWTMRRLSETIRPELLILSESDFWPNLMRSVKEQGGKVVVLNGKISEKSTRRFAKLPSKTLFDQVDQFLVQNATYKRRFESLKVPSEKITATGNLKLAIPLEPVSEEERRDLLARFGLQEGDRVITVGSTHEYEEKLIIPHIPKTYKILLAPRHPGRFKTLKVHYGCHQQVILIDQMGLLQRCFQISKLAILGGSFIAGIGGHNIYEPIQAGIPVIFGPFMENQRDLAALVLSERAGIQTSAEMLGGAIPKALGLTSNAKQLAGKGNHVLEKTLEALAIN